MKRRRWFEVHSWVGVFGGLVMFVICWSGTVAVFAHEIDWLLDARMRAPPSPVVSWDRLAASVDAAHPDATHYSLHAPRYPGFAAHAVVDTPVQAMRRVYLDPATGAMQGATSYFNVQRFFRSLHMSLFDLGSGRLWGYYVVCSFAVLLLVSAVTPLVFYRRWWRGFSTLKTRRGGRVFWSDFHKLNGVWSLAFAFVIALTGVWYLVELPGVDFGYPATPEVPARDLPAQRSLDALVDGVGERWPGLAVTSVGVARGNWLGPVVYVEGQAEAWLVRDRSNHVLLDPATGAVVHRQDARGLGWPARWVDTADPLHFGDFAGLWTQALWFVFGLSLSGLCLTGAYLHVKRLHAARHRIWPGTSLAIAATFVLLGIAAWGCWNEMLAFGPVVAGEAALPALPGSVIGFLVAWTAVTLAILAIWSAAIRKATAPSSGPSGSLPR